MPANEGALSEPQLKSINKSWNSSVSKNSLVKENGVSLKILSIQYLTFIKGLKAVSKEPNSGISIAASELSPDPPSNI